LEVDSLESIVEIQEIMYKYAMIDSDIETINEGIRKLDLFDNENSKKQNFSLSFWKLNNAICLSKIILDQMKSKIENEKCKE
jgi:hypothetical protein